MTISREVSINNLAAAQGRSGVSPIVEPVIFSNFTESIAEACCRAQAVGLRPARKDVTANKGAEIAGLENARLPENLHRVVPIWAANQGTKKRHDGKSQKIFRTNVGLSTRLNIRVMQADGFIRPATRHVGHQLNQPEPLENNMSRILALGLVAFAIFTGIAKGDEGGGGDFKPGVNPRTISSKLLGADTEVHMLVAKSVEENGDYVMTIQKSKNSKEWLGVKGDVVDWGVGKPAEWVLHKNTAGWSIMLKSDQALAISLNETKDGLVLQRNQGEKHQLWEIEKQK